MSSTYNVLLALDGYCKIPDLVKRAKELGWTAAAITDHNHLGGIPDFKQECENQGIKPLLGCCLPDQLIYTSEGMKEIQDIKVGDQVLTHNGVYKKVIKHWSRQYNGILYGIKSWNASTVWLTEEHPVLVRSVKRTGKRHSYHWSDLMQWIRADQITQKRLLATCHNRDEFQRLWQNWTTFPKHQKQSDIKVLNLINFLTGYIDHNGFLVKAEVPSYYQVKTLIPSSVELTPELMRVFGLFIAEGSYVKEKNGTVCALNFAFHSKEYTLHNMVTQTLSKVFNVNIGYYNRENYGRNCTEIMAFSVPLAKVFYAMFGEYAHNKSFPVWFYTLDLSLQKAFLEGIELGDAKFYSRRVYLKLANRKLIYQIRALLANLGITSSISKITQHRKGNVYTSWGLDYTHYENLGRYYYSDERYVYMPLRTSKETMQYNGLVYNFTVEDDNSYVTDIILHNCESYYTFSTRLLAAPVDIRNKLAERDAVISGLWIQEDIDALKSTDKTKLHKQFGYDTTGYHILFIAKNQQGWQNLVKLQSESSRLCTFNGRYHCDMKLLKKYHEGLIVSTACIGSYPSEMICTRRESFAVKYLEQMKEIFQDDFYLEIQPLNIRRQQQTNWFYYKWGKENGVKTIATNDSHWVNKEDAADHDVLLCIGLYEKLANPTRMRYMPEFWVRSEEEMREAFERQADNMKEKFKGFKKEPYLAYCYQALSNTQEIVDKVDNDIKLGSQHHLFPAVKLKDTPEQTLRTIAEKGLNDYLLKNKELDSTVYRDKLKEELDIICSKGFAPYFLTLEELIKWCDIQSIPVGPGRGSAAGSLVLLCLGVTKNIDPIKMKLWFSRFMTKDRKDIPDVDVDFSWLNRDKVVKHLEEVYGKQCVAHIGTFSTLKVKSAVKDVARVLDVSFSEALQISKDIDSISDDPNLTFEMIDSWKEGTLDERQLYQRFATLEEEYSEIFGYARKFEGIPRQMGIHASGILVTPMPVSDIFPVRYVDGTAVTLYTGVQVDEFKACKLDILGLKTLDIIDIALKSIDPSFDINYLYDKVDIKDPKIYKMIREKKTDAVFQLESDTMKNIIETIKPTNFEDIVVINSVARPGPLSCNMHVDYAKRKAGEQEISYPISGCNDILSPTFGIIPFQELLMAISKRIAGFDDTQADSITRKIVAKKKQNLWPMLIRCHVYGKKNCEGPAGWEDNDKLPWYDPKEKYGGEIKGAVANGYSAKEVLNFFESIEEFASYCFNRSHAACYSMISLLTAWLKLYYPVEFWAAVLTVTDDSKVNKYLQIIRNSGIEVCVPDINVSNNGFVAAKKKILFGLGKIKGLGEATVNGILEERKKGLFASIEDINNRLPKRILRQNAMFALIKAGAFDGHYNNRLSLLNRFLDVRKDKKTVRFDETKYDNALCQDMEEEVLGSSVTYRRYWDEIDEEQSVKDIKARVVSKVERYDKWGHIMGFFELTVEDSKISALMFSSCYRKYGTSMTEGKDFLVSGKKTNGKLLISKATPFVEE